MARTAMIALFSCFIALAGCQKEPVEMAARRLILQNFGRIQSANLAENLDVKNVAMIGTSDFTVGTQKLKAYEISADVSGVCKDGKVVVLHKSHYKLMQDPSGAYSLALVDFATGKALLDAPRCDR
jgi:hypothetical protein